MQFGPAAVHGIWPCILQGPPWSLYFQGWMARPGKARRPATRRRGRLLLQLSTRRRGRLHARRLGHGALPAPPGYPTPSASTRPRCAAPGASLPPLDPAAWWLAPPGGPPRAPANARAPGDSAAWWLAPPGGPPLPRAPAPPAPRAPA
jgi:hypothetical protein